jgi:sugar-phosphatase
MPDVVLFELEGVLADTAEARRAAALAALDAAGVRASDDEHRALAAGLPTRDGIAVLLAAHDAPRDETAVDLATADAERRFARWLAKGATMRRGADSLVRALEGRARLGIVTRATRAEAASLLALSTIADAFEFVLCAEDAFPSKPSAAPYRAALARLERRRAVQPARVVALEDAVAGVRSARGAGVRAMIVGDAPAHVAMEADALIPSLGGFSPEALDALLAADAVPRHG